MVPTRKYLEDKYPNFYEFALGCIMEKSEIKHHEELLTCFMDDIIKHSEDDCLLDIMQTENAKKFLANSIDLSSPKDERLYINFRYEFYNYFNNTLECIREQYKEDESDYF